MVYPMNICTAYTPCTCIQLNVETLFIDLAIATMDILFINYFLGHLSSLILICRYGGLNPHSQRRMETKGRWGHHWAKYNVYVSTNLCSYSRLCYHVWRLCCHVCVMIPIFNKENKDDLFEFEMTNLLNVREKLNLGLICWLPH